MIYLCSCEHDIDTYGRVEAISPAEATEIYANNCGEIVKDHQVYILDEDDLSIWMLFNVNLVMGLPVATLNNIDWRYSEY